MLIFFEYMLRISLIFGIIYLFYIALLKPLTHYTCNRGFLLASSILAFFIPLLKIDFFIAPQKVNALSFINNIPTVSVNAAGNAFIPEESSVNIVYILLVLFISGIIIRSLYFFTQFRSFKKIRAAAQLVNQTEGVRLYHLNMDIKPFSFNNSIYINRLSHSEGELTEIIRHECVHVHQKHTFDVLIAELICILNWYNPFAWLIKHAIKQNLEFLADDVVIKNGTDKKSYQYLLLKVMGHSPLAIASNLNFSSLKKRIYMMNKTKTSKKHLLKFLLILPVIVLIMLAFRDHDSHSVTTNEKHNYTKEETFKLSELTYSITDPSVAMIVKKEQEKSLLQVGHPFTITLIKNERDRLKLLLERNGYNNITDHSISFLIDSSLTNNSFSVQVNIDLQTKAQPVSKINDVRNKKANTNINGNNNKQYHFISSGNAGYAKSIEPYQVALQSLHANNVNSEYFSII
jgi:beta-lactamase regulating signal transducer with metallopeptidase domain